MPPSLQLQVLINFISNVYCTSVYAGLSLQHCSIWLAQMLNIRPTAPEVRTKSTPLPTRNTLNLHSKLRRNYRVQFPEDHRNVSQGHQWKTTWQLWGLSNFPLFARHFFPKAFFDFFLVINVLSILVSVQCYLKHSNVHSPDFGPNVKLSFYS